MVTHSQLRIDSVSQLITMANVREGNRIIVMETCQGLLLGAILERMGGVFDVLCLIGYFTIT